MVFQRHGILAFALLFFAMGPLAAQCPPGEPSFATSVSNYQPGPGVTSGVGFGIASRILCAPGGFSDVVSLGVGGTVTVSFPSPIVDGPGADFALWENGFEFGGLTFGELAYVEVSTDGVTFARFPVRYFGPGVPLGPFDGLPAGCVEGLAGLGILQLPAAIAGFADPCVSGGDAFDLEVLSPHPLVTSGTVLLSAINFVRLVDVVGDGSEVDQMGTPIFDPTNATASSDWDAIVAINTVANQNPGRPLVEVSFDATMRTLSLSVSDPDGIQTVDWPTLLVTANGQAVDLQALLAAFPVVELTASRLKISSHAFPIGSFGRVALSVSDVGGLRGNDAGSVLP